MATDQKQKDKAIILATLDRFNKIRLPHAQAFLEKVNNGEVLGDFENSIVKEVREEERRFYTLLERNPEYKDLASKNVEMWREIIDKNEENKKKQNKFTS